MRNFAALTDEFTDFNRSAIAILPVPYDETSTWIKGADMGPAALLMASLALELYDIETDSEVYRRGIYTDPPLTEKSSPEAMVAAVQKRAEALLEAGKFVVTVGGEHSVSVGSVRAHARRYPDLSVLQLDAHSDLRDEFRGSRYNHGCVMARIKETCPCVQVGIRSMAACEKAAMDRSSVFFAEQIAGLMDEQWMPEAIGKLSPHVYVTIDLDVFDPSVVPSTGTPEPGGLDWNTVIRLLRKITLERHVVGFDVVELCPDNDHKASDFLAVKLMYKMLSYVFENRSRNSA